MDDTDPLVTVMKVEKAPQETYADIGGLDNQIQEIKVCHILNSTGAISLSEDLLWNKGFSGMLHFPACNGLIVFIVDYLILICGSGLALLR